MAKQIERDRIYRKRWFDAEIIVLCVRWYISYVNRHPRLTTFRRAGLTMLLP